MNVPLPALLIVLGLALVGLLALWLVFIRRRLHLPTETDELHFVEAADGWRLALWRLRPLRGPHRPLPVLLCHGLWANRYNVHFDERLSLGRHLAERGHDVFLLELRGSGLSSQPGPRGPSGRAAKEFGFDEHVSMDAPAALERVLEVTRAEQVFWVGHSMGGMIAYALAAGPWARHLAGIVAVGSPASWRHLDGWMKRLVTRARPLLRRGLRLREGVALLAPWAGWIHPPGGTLALNPRNVEGRVIRRALFNLVGDLSPGHIAQFSKWIAEERFASRDGRVDYRAGMPHARTPIAFLAGAVDRLAPPGSVRDAFEAWGGEDRTFEVLGTRTGLRAEYGHGDLLLGRHAPEEVFPRISAWIEAREPAASPRAEPRPRPGSDPPLSHFPG